MNKIISAMVKIELEDGGEVHCLITSEGIQRWGADKETLGSMVDATEAIQAALIEADQFA